MTNKACYFISWNIRGMGQREKKTSARNLVRANKPQVTFVQEIKMTKVEDRTIKFICGNQSDTGSAISPSVGASGGLLSIWNNKFFKLESSMIWNNFIIMQGSIRPIKMKYNLVNIYPPNYQGERLSMFNELTSILHQMRAPMIIGGDFNIVLSPEEKMGSFNNRSSMKKFSKFIENLNLLDPPVNGGRFTWSNTRERPSASRLDRFLILPEILMKWPDDIQAISPKSISDHNQYP
ncbi:hypothetical protein HRI_000066600 [Hibiscus trionum]|uniref:Endonuclease/exonuclease/phosphatase domain-containing protein n=1 Tax=Hibiscus trionum TaxID=183268 RepID=A0A9W7GRG4_HIBTR|nr:hypothetical protein HRI_000066600 [Hibiscus trionum]